MPIKIVIRRYGDEELYCPEFWCDQCGKQIVGEPGNCEYPEFALSGDVPPSVDQLFYTHKDCSTPFRTTRGADRLRWHVGGLPMFLQELANNLREAGPSESLKG
jgi:hypothetical protein